MKYRTLLLAWWFTAVGIKGSMGPKIIMNVGPYEDQGTCENEAADLKKTGDIERALRCREVIGHETPPSDDTLSRRH